MKLMEVVPLSTRLLVAAKSLLTYLWKMMVPINLIPYYAYPKNVSLLSPEYLLAGAAAFGITAICIFMARKQRLPLTLWAYYVVTLIPVIGIIQVGSQAMADRYTYLPSLAPFLMMGLIMAWTWRRVNARAVFKIVGISAFLLLFTGMAYLTVAQIGIWKDSITLWNYVVEKEPVSFAYNRRGMVFDSMGKFDKAVEDYDKAVAMNPSYVEARVRLGIVYGKSGLLDKAIAQFNKAISINPDYSVAYDNRGRAYSLMGKKELAVSDFQKACDLGNREGCRKLQTLRMR